MIEFFFFVRLCNRGVFIRAYLIWLNYTERYLNRFFNLLLNEFLQHFAPEKHVFWIHVLSIQNSENILSGSCNKVEMWMCPLCNFNMFSMSDESHAYVYTTWKIVNEIGLTSKNILQIFFQDDVSFCSCHWQLFQEGFSERAKACEAASFKIW